MNRLGWHTRQTHHAARYAAPAALLLIALLAPAVLAQPTTAPDLPQLLEQLGHDDWEQRQAATDALLERGPADRPALSAHLAATTDPEVRRRLRHILARLEPVERGVLVIRAATGALVRPGDVITHIDGRTIASTADFAARLDYARPEQRVRLTPVPPMQRTVHLATPTPREVSVRLAEIETIVDFRQPTGPAVADVVGLYADGLVERAHALAISLVDTATPADVPPGLRALLDYSVGHGAAARAVLANVAEAVLPTELFYSDVWAAPSRLDLAGPVKAPLGLEWELWQHVRLDDDPLVDPDLRVQRLYIPAGRRVDALVRAAELWWHRYREPLAARQGTESDLTAAGNLLAIVSWMCADLELRSEAEALIAPRSILLQRSLGEPVQWLRVRLDGWRDLLAGDPEAALDHVYADALAALTRPLRPDDPAVLTRSPAIAAEVALLLYRTPDDPRLTELLDAVARPDQPGLTALAGWIAWSADAGNAARLPDDLVRLLPLLPPDDQPATARALALLTYALTPDDADRFALARDAARGSDVDAALIDVLAYLAAGRLDDADAVLASSPDITGAATLRATLAYRRLEHPADVAAPLLAVPIGQDGATWLVLARDGRVHRVTPATGRHEPVDLPHDDWFPGPAVWPWLGTEPATGRAWLYDRRRVMELAPADESPLRLNLRTADIATFDRVVGPVFSAFAAAVAAEHTAPAPDAEAGEYHRAAVRAFATCVADPDLPDLGWLAPVPGDGRLYVAGLRGGPDCLIEPATRRLWSGAQLATSAGLTSPLRFCARALPDQPTPDVWLPSDAGLLRLDVATDGLNRVALPGDDPHPALLPESLPYDRRAPRWFYAATPLEAGGHVWRITCANGRVEPLDMLNIQTPGCRPDRDVYFVGGPPPEGFGT